MNYNRIAVAPEGSFICNYLKSRSNSCAPIEYEYWCALVVLARVHHKSWISAYSPSDRNRVPLRLSVALLSDTGLNQRAECISNTLTLCTDSWQLCRINGCAPSDYSDVSYIPVLNETRRRGKLFTPSEYALALPEPLAAGLLLTPCAHDVLDAWNSCRRASVHKLQAAFERVEHMHVLQVAAVLALNDNAFVIDDTHARAAVKLVKHVKQHFFTALQHGYARDKAALALEKITAVLRTRQLEPLKSSELYLSVRHWIDVDTFHFCMDIMHELKFVTKYMTQGVGRRLVCYKANESLLSDDVVKQVLNEVDLS